MHYKIQHWLISVPTLNTFPSHPHFHIFIHTLYDLALQRSLQFLSLARLPLTPGTQKCYSLVWVSLCLHFPGYELDTRQA